MVKLTGADLNAFMADKAFWHEGRWYEDAVLSVNGSDFFEWEDEPIAATDKIVWDGGAVYDSGEINATFYSLETELRRWLKKRTTTTLAVEVPNEQVEAFRADMKARRLKVLA